MACLKLVALCLLGAVALSSARPRFVAIPIEDLQYLSFNGVPLQPYPQVNHRVRRAAFPDDADVPIRPRSAGDSSYAASGYGGNDYVDYGAYTGGYGAFGWYSDHPVGGGYGGYH
ncbi:uncharacterized protein LOC136038809 [Artemia franciscana]|uniref:Uncharacterized protein n=1 Tax=Artemia franciscana TaxID=6661 RepID=A0AA88L6T4_ARTSF|nr:hypothetical protein QYM36_009889 [Artemia franciscana]